MRKHPTRKLLLLAFAALCLLACPSKKEASRASAQAAEAAPRLSFEDDYPGALARARAEGLPLFVDAWAPWCHSCLSLKENVLRDKRLHAMEGRFVWLSLNTEREANAAFLERHPVQVWPTLLVIDPLQEEALLRWQGAATVEQLLGLLQDGLAAAQPKQEAATAEARLVEADRLYANGAAREAIPLLERALAEAPAAWEQRARAVLSLLAMQRYGAGEMEACARRAQQELAELPHSQHWANIAALGLRCANDLGEDPDGLRPALEARLREALQSPAVPAQGDDRSNLYELLYGTQRKKGDIEEGQKVAAEWLSFLEREAAAAKTAEARAVFDSHRLSAAFALGTPERVRAALEQSERDFPEDFNAPARLALVYHRLGRLEEALAASDRALRWVYGPRKVRVLNERGDILVAKGESAAARAAYEQACAHADGLPAAQRPAYQRQRCAAALEALP